MSRRDYKDYGLRNFLADDGERSAKWTGLIIVIVVIGLAFFHAAGAFDYPQTNDDFISTSQLESFAPLNN